MNSIQKAAGNELHVRTQQYMKTHNVKDYRKAHLEVLKADPSLARRYLQDEFNVVKAYDATPAQREMAALQADPEKARRLASYHIDYLAKQKNKNTGGIADPVAAYRRALADVSRQYPNLARCAEDGFIAADDFQLCAMLVPSVAGEVERGNYSRGDSTRCECGENKAYC